SHRCHSRAASRTERVSLGDPCRVVVTQPGSVFGVFPDQCLERQVDARQLSILHQGSAALRTSKNHQLGRSQRQADGRRASRVVNAREDFEILFSERSKQTLDRFFGGETTLHRYDAVVGHLKDPVLFIAKSLSKPRGEIREIYPADRLELMSCPRRKISSYWG